jgi:ABC-type antimicrobial peptide transport system permease subunit
MNHPENRFPAPKVYAHLGVHGVSPFDPATMVSAPLLLTVVALMACGVPARRAIRVNPVVALRQD